MKPIELWQGDCLELMKNIPDGSVDLVLTDPPYGKKADKGTNGFVALLKTADMSVDGIAKDQQKRFLMKCFVSARM